MTTYVTLNLNCAVPVVEGEPDLFWVTTNVCFSLVASSVPPPAADCFWQSIAAIGKSASSCESEQIMLNHTHRPGLRLSTNCGVSMKTRIVYFLFDLLCEA